MAVAHSCFYFKSYVSQFTEHPTEEKKWDLIRCPKKNLFSIRSGFFFSPVSSVAGKNRKTEKTLIWNLFLYILGTWSIHAWMTNRLACMDDKSTGFVLAYCKLKNIYPIGILTL